MDAAKSLAKSLAKNLALVDGLGRVARYVRISVTDRCNLRCLYCRNGMETFIPHSDVLRYEEMEALVDRLMALGVEKVRLTGGEPFARKGFADFLLRLRESRPRLDLRLTTNGTLGLPHVPALVESRINAVNLSLDTFDRARYERVTGRDLLDRAQAFLEALLEAGVPVKINAVALRGVNDDEIPAFLELAVSRPVDVRFIEYMPMGASTRWTPDRFLPAQEIRERIEERVRLLPVDKPGRNAGPARMYEIEGGTGRIGFITPLSNHFCASCNRLRITCDGKLRTCLFADREYRLRGLLRHPGLGMDAVSRVIALALNRKPVGADILARRGQGGVGARMTGIGG